MQELQVQLSNITDGQLLRWRQCTESGGGENTCFCTPSEAEALAWSPIRYFVCLASVRTFDRNDTFNTAGGPFSAATRSILNQFINVEITTV